jgi:hypothetical protein
MADGSSLNLPAPGGYTSLNWGPLSNLGMATPQQVPLGQLGQYLGQGTGAANPQFQSWFGQMFGGGQQQPWQQPFNPIAAQMEYMGYQPPGYEFAQEQQQRAFMQQQPPSQPQQPQQPQPQNAQTTQQQPQQQQQKPDDDSNTWRQVSGPSVTGTVVAPPWQQRPMIAGMPNRPNYF